MVKWRFERGTWSRGATGGATSRRAAFSPVARGTWGHGLTKDNKIKVHKIIDADVHRRLPFVPPHPPFVSPQRPLNGRLKPLRTAPGLLPGAVHRARDPLDLWCGRHWVEWSLWLTRKGGAYTVKLEDIVCQPLGG